uniref:Uncharacterized protein n=1 Tax=Octopus bimaculoides TaxID=37653 RepID=A0A0L8G648_OCTBM
MFCVCGFHMRRCNFPLLFFPARSFDGFCSLVCNFFGFCCFHKCCTPRLFCR